MRNWTKLCVLIAAMSVCSCSFSPASNGASQDGSVGHVSEASEPPETSSAFETSQTPETSQPPIQPDLECTVLEMKTDSFNIQRDKPVDIRDYLAILPVECSVTLIPQTSNIQTAGSEIVGLGVGPFTVVVMAGSNNRSLVANGVVVEKECMSIKASDSLNTDLLIGSSINLAEYVSVDPTDCVWSISSSSKNIIISDKTITAVQEGEFEVSIVAGSNSLSKSIKGVVRDLYKKAAEELANGNYTMSLKNSTGQIKGLTWHNERYFGLAAAQNSGRGFDLAFRGAIELGNDEILPYMSAGDVQFDETTSLPLGGDIETLSKTRGSNETKELMKPIKTEGDEFYFDQKESAILMNEDALRRWLKCSFEIELDRLSSVLEPKVKTYVSLNENGLLKLNLVFSSGELYYIDFDNVGATSIGSVEEYIKTLHEPEQLKFEAFNALMTKGIEEKNYALKGTLETGYYDDNKVWHSSTNANALSSLKEDWGIEPASFQAYVDGETYYSINDATKDISGYAVWDGVLYSIKGAVDEEGATYDWEYDCGPIFENETANSIWDNNLSQWYFAKKYISHAALAIGDYTEEMLASISWASVTTDKNGNVTATATPYGDEGHALALGMALVPQIGNSYAGMMSTLSHTNLPSLWYDFFDRQEYVYNKADNSITINTTLDYIASSGGVYYGVRFIVEIGSVGTTTLPSGFPECAFSN